MTHPAVKHIKAAMPDCKWKQVDVVNDVCVYRVWNDREVVQGTMLEIKEKLCRKN